MIIATRTLYVETDEGEKPVAVRIYMPTPVEPDDPASPHQECRYEIDWPERTDTLRAGGNDGMALPKGARDFLIGDDQRFYGVDESSDLPDAAPPASSAIP